MNLPTKSIDPSLVPTLTIRSSGAQIPVIGFGSFGSDHVSASDMAEAVKMAVLTGYRHIDCAAVYGNEREIGRAIRELIDAGVVKREELWITSKIWNDHHGQGDVLLSCAQTLKDLQMDYLDLMLIHWPFPNYHPPQCSVDSRSPNAKPYIHNDFMKTYRQLEALEQMGLVRHIGVSNVTIPKLKLILQDCRIKPDVHELELHPNFQQTELRRFGEELGIVHIGYCPLGSPHRPERDREADDSVDMEDPVVQSIALAHGIHPSAVCLKWAVQNGCIPIPTSTNPSHILSNLEAVIQDPLSPQEIEQMSCVDKNCRLIKGHVFLWPSAHDWHDLWDERGVISC